MGKRRGLGGVVIRYSCLDMKLLLKLDRCAKESSIKRLLKKLTTAEGLDEIRLRY